MDFQAVFVLWEMTEDGPHILPGCHIDGSSALFWADVWCSGNQVPVVVDAVPAAGYFSQLNQVLFCAQVSEESFVNAWRNLEAFCGLHGGLTERDGMEGRPSVNWAEF